MISRIQEVMEQKKLSPSQFAEEIGVQRSGISHILSGRNKPSLEFILKILNRFPEINTAWLLYGKYQEEEKNIRFSQSDKKPEPNNFTSDQSVNVGLFAEIPEIKPLPVMEQPTVKKAELVTNKEIEKLLICYTDNTFSEYIPGKR